VTGKNEEGGSLHFALSMEVITENEEGTKKTPLTK
jgi:hypothetical protein